jgi:hypothetical protein
MRVICRERSSTKRVLAPVEPRQLFRFCIGQVAEIGLPLLVGALTMRALEDV